MRVRNGRAGWIAVASMAAWATHAGADAARSSTTTIAPPKRLELVESAAGPTGAAVDIASVPRVVRRAVVADAARRFGVAESAVVISDAEQVTWPDGSLGCPRPGRVYTQMQVAGYRLTAKTSAGELRYHADTRGNAVTCGASTQPRDPGMEPGTQPPGSTPDR